MKNLLLYYFLAFTPLGILFWIDKIHLLDGGIIVVLLLFYALIYRTYLDGKRLADKNVIQKKDIWKMIIPGKRFQYLKELYLK